MRIRKGEFWKASPIQHAELALIHMHGASFGQGGGGSVNACLSGKWGFGGQFAVWRRVENRMGQVLPPSVPE